jgi:SH3 domain protein
VRHGSLILASVWLALAQASYAQDLYVRDELRINLRDGPGDGYSVVRVLVSGDPVSLIDQRRGWLQVRTGEGSEGWLPEGYLSEVAPASVALPRLESQLAKARKRVQLLEGEVATKNEVLREVEELRERNAALEELNEEGSERWRNMTAGAAIALAGVVLGLLLPRSAPARGRRIKL